MSSTKVITEDIRNGIVPGLGITAKKYASNGFICDLCLERFKQIKKLIDNCPCQTITLILSTVINKRQSTIKECSDFKR